MKKFYSLLVLMMVAILSLQAQPPKGMGNSDPEAKKVLDAVSAKFKTYKAVQAKFLLKIEMLQEKHSEQKQVPFT